MMRFWTACIRCSLILAGVVLCIPGEVRGHGETLIQIAAVTRQLETATTNRAELFLRRGELYREHGAWESAEADYARAKELAPEMVAVDVARAGMLADSGDVVKSRELFDAIIARVDDNGEAFLGRARVKVLQGEKKEALADYRRALQLLQMPEPETYVEISQALKEGGFAKEALAALDRGINRYGPIPPLEKPAVELEVEAKNYGGALERLQLVIDLAGRKENWLAWKGDILVEAGRASEACVAYHAALAAIELLPPRLVESPDMGALQARVLQALQTHACNDE